MGGPIIRTGTTPAFWANWEKVFAGKTATKKKPAAAKPAVAKPVAKKSAKKKTAKKGA